jgi:NADH:ubiquinone oxidoreductase subunit K
MTVQLMNFLIISFFVFLIGLLGIFFIKKNIIIVLMAIELMLLSININFVVFSVYLDDILGQIFALFILTVAAAESAIGLAILVVYYRIRGIISMNFINSIKG